MCIVEFCRSGGIKYQMYSVKNGVLFLQAENKPREGANLSAFSIGVSSHSFKMTICVSGGYMPKASTPFDKLQEALFTELKSAPWNNSANTPVYAFITGKIRQHWEDASQGEKQLMEEQMDKLFGPLSIKKLQQSYFMSQVCDFLCVHVWVDIRMTKVAWSCGGHKPCTPTWRRRAC